MANIRRIGGRSIALTLLAICPPAAPAVSADLPVKTNHAAQPVLPLGRTCIGTDGKPFRWDWPNAPFAAVCTNDQNGLAAPSTPPRQAPP
jgi:hypothetical protein